MSRTGRIGGGALRVPNEVHRARGTQPDRRGKRLDGGKESTTDAAQHGIAALPPEDSVQPLPSVEETGFPDYPEGLGEAGRELWDQAWQPEVIWLSPKTDYRAVEHACRAYEAFLATHEAFMGMLQLGQLDKSLPQTWATTSRALGEALNDIGLNPMARSRLGVAEVKKTLSKMEKLQQQFNKAKRESES